MGSVQVIYIRLLFHYYILANIVGLQRVVKCDIIVLKTYNFNLKIFSRDRKRCYNNLHKNSNPKHDREFRHLTVPY